MKKVIFGQDLGSRNYNLAGEKLIQVKFKNSHGIEHQLVLQSTLTCPERERERERERDLTGEGESEAEAEGEATEVSPSPPAWKRRLRMK